jgi:hypothetical protein
MSIYWCFRLDHVARRVLYLDDAMRQIESYTELSAYIGRFRAQHGKTRAWRELPM